MITCVKCSNGFPTTQKIDGKTRVYTSRKYCLKCSPFGSRNTKKLEQFVGNVKLRPPTKMCKRCREDIPLSNYYVKKNGDQYPYCKTCANKRSGEECRRLKVEFINFLGGSCVVCGYNRYPGALNFHHIDPKKKDFTISKRRLILENAKDELSKCLLVCTRCHSEIHGGLHEGLLSKGTDPVTKYVGSAETKVCMDCKIQKPLIDFHRLQSKPESRPYCKSCNNKRSSVSQKKTKQRCVEYCGGKCMICNYSTHIGALHFHHKNPAEKEFSISSLKNSNFEKAKSELDKCILLCNRCHAEVHGGLHPDVLAV